MTIGNPKPYPAGTQLKGIVTPHEHDVLSGRGNFVNYHTGNEHFRSLVKKHKIAYVACPKPEKGRFSKVIVDEIRSMDPPGRFLKQNQATKLWEDIGDKKSLDKARQALREGAPELLKELTGEDPKVGVWFYLYFFKFRFVIVFSMKKFFSDIFCVFDSKTNTLTGHMCYLLSIGCRVSITCRTAADTSRNGGTIHSKRISSRSPWRPPKRRSKAVA